MTYHQPIRIEVHYNSKMDSYIECPVYSPEAYAEADALLNEILQGAEDNGVKPEYYMKEFL
jgi:hypothetical protein